MAGDGGPGPANQPLKKSKKDGNDLSNYCTPSQAAWAGNYGSDVLRFPCKQFPSPCPALNVPCTFSANGFSIGLLGPFGAPSMYQTSKLLWKGDLLAPFKGR